MLWSWLFWLICMHSAFAKLVTTLIDDAFPGDAQSSVSYFPSLAVWGAGTTTNHGRITPDASRAQNNTWHDTTDDTTPTIDGTTPTYMEVKFQGSGIDIRCIIANNLADPSIRPGTGTKANYSFFIDTVPQKRDYIHVAGTTGDAYLYDTSVFSTSGLSSGPHTMKLLLNGGEGVDGSVLLLFDYAIATFDDGTGDSTSPSASGEISASAATPSSVRHSTPESSSSQPRTVASSSARGGVSSTASAPPAPTRSGPSGSSLPIPAPLGHKFNTGAVIGGIGGGLLVLLLVLSFFWLRRRRSSHRPPPIFPFSDTNSHFSRPRSLLNSFATKKAGRANPDSSVSPRKQDLERRKRLPRPAGPSAGSSSESDSAMRDHVHMLRAEVERLREQQREMVARQRALLSLEPPPRYEAT
ncbi:hypothetical protein B0H15DRAFT_389634 [Mycena belliarum]|uniref:Uncharacterized protein n=1 Tax=Mycena belliarum TaxID=1033014 RepID=A0AAD6XM77_9AGAR|nr:hypothetical protein B0H15DRAFT_389634 [Mycena belliae]